MSALLARRPIGRAFSCHSSPATGDGLVSRQLAHTLSGSISASPHSEPPCWQNAATRNSSLGRGILPRALRVNEQQPRYKSFSGVYLKPSPDLSHDFDRTPIHVVPCLSQEPGGVRQAAQRGAGKWQSHAAQFRPSSLTGRLMSGTSSRDAPIALPLS